MPRFQISKPIQRIVDLAACIGVKRIHRKITPRCIAFKAIGILNCGAAAVGFNILAKRGDFIGRTLADHRDGAMFNAGWNGF